jgi:hypothetical protein
MNVYRISLSTPKSEITQLPDSQKVFGALVYSLADACPAQAVDSFVDGVYTGQIALAISSVTPAGYLPTPKPYLRNKGGYVADLTSDKEVYAEIKKRDFIPSGSITEVLSDVTRAIGTSYVYSEQEQQVRVAISGEFRSTGLPNDLYTVPKLLYKQHDNNNGDESRVSNYESYILAEDSSTIIQHLRSDVPIGHQFLLGKRSSQGFNVFTYQGLSECDDIASMYGSAMVFLNLGMLLPRPGFIDYKSEYTALELFTSERRPFAMNAVWSRAAVANTPNYISFIAPGSLIGISQGQAYLNAGRSVYSPFQQANKAIVFGNSFMYPLGV